MKLKDLKNGAVPPAPVYKSKPYVVLSLENVVLATGSLTNLKRLSSYFDDFVVEARKDDLHLNDNTKLVTEPAAHVEKPLLQIGAYRPGGEVNPVLVILNKDGSMMSSVFWRDDRGYKYLYEVATKQGFIPMFGQTIGNSEI